MITSCGRAPRRPSRARGCAPGSARGRDRRARSRRAVWAPAAAESSSSSASSSSFSSSAFSAAALTRRRVGRDHARAIGPLRERAQLSPAHDRCRHQRGAALGHAPDGLQPERLREPLELLERSVERRVVDARKLNPEHDRQGPLPSTSRIRGSVMARTMTSDLAACKQGRDPRFQAGAAKPLALTLLLLM